MVMYGYMAKNIRKYGNVCNCLIFDEEIRNIWRN